MLETKPALPSVESVAQSLENTSLEKLDNIKNAALAEVKRHVEQVCPGSFMHTNQVLAISKLLIAQTPEVFDSPYKIWLLEMCVALHDLEKDFSRPASLATHAYLSAKAIPEFLSHVVKVELPETVVVFIQQAVEEHSDIPYIQNRLYSDFGHLTKATAKEEAPNLSAATGYGLPGPSGDVSYALRAADMLSNYGLFPELTMNTPQETYAGFLKIVRINVSANLKAKQPLTLSEIIADVARTASESAQSGIYSKLPVATELLNASVTRMLMLSTYLKNRPETDNCVSVEDLDQKLLTAIAGAI